MTANSSEDPRARVLLLVSEACVAMLRRPESRWFLQEGPGRALTSSAPPIYLNLPFVKRRFGKATSASSLPFRPSATSSLAPMLRTAHPFRPPPSAAPPAHPPHPPPP